MSMSYRSNSAAIRYTLDINTELSHHQIRQLEIVLMRTLNLVSDFTGGNKDLQKAIIIAESGIETFRSLQIAIRSVELAAGPIGWAYAGFSLLAAGMSGYSMLESITGVS
jgi:hypothetical protein